MGTANDTPTPPERAQGSAFAEPGAAPSRAGAAPDASARPAEGPRGRGGRGRSRHPLSEAQRERWARVGMLAALALVLGYLETFIPIPIPGVKLGLANIAVLIALVRRDVAGAFCVGVIKVLATGFLFGNPVTMAYSAVGTLLAFAVMAPLSKVRGLSVILVSIAGALAHEAGQLVVAMVLLGTPLVWYSAPVLAVAGCITGALCGAVASRAMAREGEASQRGVAPSDAHARSCEAPGGDAHRAQAPQAETRPAAAPQAGVADLPGAGRNEPLIRANPRAALVVFIVFAVVVLHLQGIPALMAALAGAAVAGIVARAPLNALVKALRPTLFILAVTFAAQVMSLQAGNVILEVGPVALTQEAVEQTAVMVLRLVALVVASAAVMQMATPAGLVEATGWLMSPLARLGVRTEGFTYALEVALATVPLLAAGIQQEQWTWKTWKTSVPEFIARHI